MNEAHIVIQLNVIFLKENHDGIAKVSGDWCDWFRKLVSFSWSLRKSHAKLESILNYPVIRLS